MKQTKQFPPILAKDPLRWWVSARKNWIPQKKHLLSPQGMTGGWRMETGFVKPWDFWVDILCLKKTKPPKLVYSNKLNCQPALLGANPSWVPTWESKKIEWWPLSWLNWQKLDEGWSRVVDSCQSLSIHNIPKLAEVLRIQPLSQLLSWTWGSVWVKGPPRHLMRQKILRVPNAYSPGIGRISDVDFLFFSPTSLLGRNSPHDAGKLLFAILFWRNVCIDFPLTKFSGILKSPYIWNRIVPYSKYPNVWSHTGGIQPTILQALLLLLTNNPESFEEFSWCKPLYIPIGVKINGLL